MKLKPGKLKINFKGFFKTIFAALISSFLISTLFISIPQTEMIYDKVRYDILLAPEIWKKEYTLELSIKASDFSKREKKIEETKAILEKRLRKYGVQEMNFSERRSNSRDKAILVLTVESDKNQTSVERLITQRYYLRFVLRKEGVNFEDDQNPYVQYDPNNYEGTPYTLHDFRHIYITKLKTTTGDLANFSIYKPWEHKASQFYSYFDEYAGQFAGIDIDGFVSPIVVPVTAGGISNGIISRNPFALGVTGEADDIKVLNILANTGVIPVKYSQTGTKELQTTIFEIDYIKTIVLISLLTIFVYIVMFFITKKENLISFFAYLFSATTTVAVIKLFSIPLQPIIALYSALLITLLLPILSNSKAVSVTIAITGLVLGYLGVGYIQDVGFYIFYILLSFVGMQYLLSYFIKLVKEIISND